MIGDHPNGSLIFRDGRTLCGQCAWCFLFDIQNKYFALKTKKVFSKQFKHVILIVHPMMQRKRRTKNESYYKMR